MNPGLTITEKTIQAKVPVTVFQLQGDIDGNTYEQLQTRAHEAFQNGARYLLLDLSEVPYISSAGIRALHYIFNLLRSDPAMESDQSIREGVRSGAFKSPHLKLLNPNPGVTRVLEMAGYDMFLEIHRDRKTALDSFG